MNVIMKRYYLVYGVVCALIPLINGAPGGRGHAAGTTTYDQKQTGKYNIHLNIKDVAIIAVGSESLSGGIGDAGSFYEDYYDYDVNDFTINPISAALGVTTKKPKPSLNVTSIQDILNLSGNKPDATMKPAMVMVVSGVSEDSDSPDQIDDDDDDDELDVGPLLSANNHGISNQKPEVKPTEKPEQKPSNQALAGQSQSDKPALNKTQSVVILSNASDANSTAASSNHPFEGITISTSSLSTESPIPPPVPSTNTIIEDDGSQIPVHIIMEPVLQPKVRQSNNNPSHRLNNRIHKNGAVGGEPIGQANISGRVHNVAGRVKARRNTQNDEARCGRNQMLDRQGRCQSRRSDIAS